MSDLLVSVGRGVTGTRKIGAIIFMLFAATPALADHAVDITLTLTPSEVAAIQRSLNRQPMSQQPPAGYWPIQVKIIDALKSNPAAQRAFEAAMK